MAALIPALLLALCGVWSLLRGEDVYSALTTGAREGLSTLAKLSAALVCLLPAVSMLRASGAAELLAAFFSPLLRRLGLPEELSLLMLLRPISGSAALAEGAALMERYGADSLLGRTAAVMLGSTDTTFYVIAVYFGSAGVKKSRHAVPAALTADLVGFIAAAGLVRRLFG